MTALDPAGVCPMCGLALRAAVAPPPDGTDAPAMPSACDGCALREAGRPVLCPRCGYVVRPSGAGAGLLGRIRCALRHWLRPAGPAALLLAFLSAASPRGVAAPLPDEAPVSRSRYLMGTSCVATAYGPDAGAAIDAAFDEIARLEQILSDYRDDSELSRLNRLAGSGPVACSADMADFLTAALAHSRDTGGAFDITIGPLTRALRPRDDGAAAAGSGVEAAFGLVGWSRIDLDPASRQVRLRAGTILDPGALGKGFALDAAARVLRGRGIGSALFDFGGQILAMGPPPAATHWEVGVAHPMRRDTAALILHVRDCSVSTSGNAERGVHVIDPRTGRPVRVPGSATAIAPTGTEADALSTALLVMGPEEGLAWAGSRPRLAALFLEPAGPDALSMRATASLSGYNPSRIPLGGSHTQRSSR